ncbi:MAG: hypothetical protein ACFCU1_10930 [Sumerlaeia bacterium]
MEHINGTRCTIALLILISWCAVVPVSIAAQTQTTTPPPPVQPIVETPEEPKKSGGLLGGVGGALGSVGSGMVGAVGDSVGTVTGAPGAALGLASGGLFDVAAGGLTTSLDNAVRVHEEYPANIQTHILQDDATTTVVLSIKKVADSMEELPDKIAAAVVKVLQETGDQQPEIRETLTVVDENLDSVDGIVKSITGLVGETTRTAESATPLMREVTALMETLNQGSRLANQKLELMKNLPQDPPAEPVDLKEVDAIVQSATATLAEVRKTVEEIRIMTEKGTLKEGSMIVSDEINATINSTLSGVQGIVMRLVVGLILIIIVFFGMLGALAWFRLWIQTKFPTRKA